MINLNTIEWQVLIMAIFVIGFAFGIVVSFAERCHYCGKIVIIRKTNIRLPYEYGFLFIPYHRQCYMKYKKVSDNQIVS